MTTYHKVTLFPRDKGFLMFTKEEKERIRNFITPDLRPSYLLFKDKNEHPDKYALEEEQSLVKIKPRKCMANYFEQFRDDFVTNVSVNNTSVNNTSVKEELE